MALAVMLSTDRDALACDMAETYHVMDVWALPVETLAVLASGLRDDSRIRLKLAGMEYVPMEVLAASVLDKLALILYSLTADKHDPLPASVMDIIMKSTTKPKETTGFASGAEFEAARRKLLGVEDDE